MRLLTIAVVLALALVGAGCGGDDETSADSDDITIETTTDETTTDETTDETTDDDTGDFDFASGECRELVDASTELSQAFGAAGQDGDLGDVSELFDEFAENAPDEIRDDFATLADAYASYADVIADIDIDSGETPDAEALAQLQEALASINQEEVAAASQRISDWAEENC